MACPANTEDAQGRLADLLQHHFSEPRVGPMLQAEALFLAGLFLTGIQGRVRFPDEALEPVPNVHDGFKHV